MIRAVVFATLAAAVSAFVAPKVSGASSLKMSDQEMSRSLPFLKKPKNLDGLVGSYDFDPFGFGESFDIKWMQESEIKHGRVAMLAAAGCLFTQTLGLHIIPGSEGPYTISNPIDGFFAVGPWPALQIFAFCGFVESILHKGKLGMTDMHTDGAIPGDFGVGHFYYKGKSQAEINDLKLKEIKNGRLAMFGIGGIIHHTIVTGSDTLGAFPNPNLWN